MVTVESCANMYQFVERNDTCPISSVRDKQRQIHIILLANQKEGTHYLKACFDEKTSYIPPKVQTLVKIDHTCILQTVAYFLENRIYFYFCYNVIKVCMVPLICPHIHRIAAYCVFFFNSYFRL